MWDEYTSVKERASLEIPITINSECRSEGQELSLQACLSSTSYSTVGKRRGTYQEIGALVQESVILQKPITQARDPISESGK